ncbi:hypothetical protein TCAL_06656, partial [Tigriopus californicus]
ETRGFKTIYPEKHLNNDSLIDEEPPWQALVIKILSTRAQHPFNTFNWNALNPLWSFLNIITTSTPI